jgi:hypothetical protein
LSLRAEGREQDLPHPERSFLALPPAVENLFSHMSRTVQFRKSLVAIVSLSLSCGPGTVALDTKPWAPPEFQAWCWCLTMFVGQLSGGLEWTLFSLLFACGSQVRLWNVMGMQPLGGEGPARFQPCPPLQARSHPWPNPAIHKAPGYKTQEEYKTLNNQSTKLSSSASGIPTFEPPSTPRGFLSLHWPDSDMKMNKPILLLYYYLSCIIYSDCLSFYLMSFFCTKSYPGHYMTFSCHLLRLLFTVTVSQIFLVFWWLLQFWAVLVRRL